MKIAFFAVVASFIVSPVFAADLVVKTKPQVFVKDSQKSVDGIVHIRAVSLDGKRVAKVRIEKDGSVVGEIEGKKVNVSFDSI